jgi:creatinine amidohydrolase
MLHMHPQRVKGSAEREYPRFPAGILVRDKRRYWPNGIWGDPTLATAEKGARLEEAVVGALEHLIERLEEGENDQY